MTTLLDARLSKALRHFAVDVTLSVGPETLVLVGHSGCGKTTTLRMLAGLVVPDDGRIVQDGTVLYDRSAGVPPASPEDRRIGYVVQNYGLFPHLTVARNVGFGLHGVPRDQRAGRVAEMLETFALTHLAEAYPATLSGGEQQRVAMARALVTSPRLVLLDEPLSALDASIRGRLRAELKATLARLEIPSIVVTHDFEDARLLGDRIAVMDRGEIIQTGTPEEIGRVPASPFVASFAGTNLVAAHGAPAVTTLAPAEGTHGSWVAFDPWAATLRAALPGGGDQPAPGDTWTFTGRLVDVAGVGPSRRVSLETPSGERLLVDCSTADLAALDLTIGDRAHAVVPRSAARPAPAPPRPGAPVAEPAPARRNTPPRRARWLAAGLALALVAAVAAVLAGRSGAPSPSAPSSSSASAAPAGSGASVPLVGSIAANLATALPTLVAQYDAHHHGNLALQANYAGTQILLTQLEQGAPSNLFVSADLRYMQEAVARGVVTGGYEKIAEMSPVIIVPKANPGGVTSLHDLGTKNVTVVIGVDSVPVGHYAREVFQNADAGYGPRFSARVMSHVVAEETDTSQVAQEVATGQADAGVVYRTDVTPNIASKVRIIAIPSRYDVVASNYAAVPAHADHRSAVRRFIAYVVSPAGQAVLRRFGYLPVLPGAARRAGAS